MSSSSPISQPRSQKALRSVALLAAVAAAAPMPALADLSADQTPFHSFRGLWVSRFEYSQNTTSISNIMANAQSLGITDVFFQVRGQADAYYNSAFEVRTNNSFDSLAAAVTQAQSRGIRLHAWINTIPLWQGATASTNPAHLMNTRPEFWVRDANNSPQPLGSSVYVGVNGTRADVQTHINNVVQDIASKYAIDGLHLDYIRNVTAPVGGVVQYPADPETVGRFQAIPGNAGRTPTSHPNEYKQFIADGITNLVSGVRQTLKTTRPTAQLTAAVWRDATIGYNDYQQQWNTWLDRGLLDAAMPMIYFENSTTYNTNVTSAVQHRGNAGIMPGLGVYLQEEGGNTFTEAYNNVTNQLNVAKNAGANGVTIYSYSSVFGSSQAAQGNEQALRDFFAANNVAPAAVAVNNFDTNEGYFAWSPTLSGSNTGISSATADRVTTESQAGGASQQIVINKNPASSSFFLRHLSGIGTAADFASNLQFSSIGSISFWLKTTTPDIQVSIALDDTTTGDRGYLKNVIADGNWHRYEWFLNDVTHWDNWAGGNGQIGQTFSIDSIQFTGTGATNTLFLDELSYNAAAVAPDQWRQDGNATWQNAANWQGPVPNAIGATANLLRRATANTTITLSSNVTLGTLTIDNNAASYTISGQQILLDSTTGNSARVNVLNRGSHTIASNIRFNDTTFIDIDRGSVLNLTGTLTSTSARDIQKIDDGILNVSGPLTLAVASRFLVNGGTLNLSSPSATNSLNLTVQSGTLNIQTPNPLLYSTISISDGAMNLDVPQTTLRATSLALTGGALNSADADFIVNYSTTSPLATLNTALSSGLIVPADNIGGVSALLVLFEAADLALTSFNGFAVDATAVIGKFTYTGDANLDDQVNSFDYSIIDDNFGQSGSFITGDLNGDGTIDSFDYSAIDDTFGAGVGSLIASNTEVFIPEPSSLAGLALLGSLMVRRRS